MSAAHTPGPWRKAGDATVLGADGKEVAYLARNTRYGAETEASARLIAAAPALLEACEAIIHYDTADQNDHVALMLDYASMIEKARAAIALAKGESA